MKPMNVMYLLVSCIICGCTETDWNAGYDIEFPVPVVDHIDKSRVEVGDIMTMTGEFTKLSNVTIGGGFAEIISVSDDNSEAQVLVSAFCSTGKLVVENLYKQKYTYPENIVVENSASVTVDVIDVLDFSSEDFIPFWVKSTWAEARDPESRGYDLNMDDIAPPEGYEHYYSINDKSLFPPEEALGQNGNIPYGNLTWNNNGNGFDLSLFSDPYVSVLINTGDDIAYISLVADEDIKDFEPSHSPGGTFANGETAHYMKTDGKWMWYTFSLDKIFGADLPEKFEELGIFVRNSWDYGADIYPGFQLNIANMSITEGAKLNDNLDKVSECVIFDTDMCFDVDDVGALAVLHKYADNGYADILGVCFNEIHVDGPAAIDAINTWYGRGDIPVGVYPYDLTEPDASKYLSALAEYPNDISENQDAVRNAVDLYAEILSGQPDHSVTIISVGFMNNLALLMDTHRDLVTRKVKKLVQMGGLNNDDFNFVRHDMTGTTKKVLKEWPSLVVISEYGGDVYTGDCLADEPDSPVREAYFKWFDSSFEGRSSWDIIAVMYAIEGDRYFTEHWDSQVNFIDGDVIMMQQGKLHYIVPRLSSEEYRSIINDMMCR